MISFRVLGVPAPQGSKTRMPNGAMLEGGSATGRAKQRAWRGAVAEEAIRHVPDAGPLDCPLLVDLVFRLPRPKSAKNKTWSSSKPDIDKLIRSTLDGLTDAGLIRDDARVVSLTATKRYADEWIGAKVMIVTDVGE